MTERRGGSDVAAGTDTIASRSTTSTDINEYNLYGYKWFSSATDSDISITLARIKDQDGNIVQVMNPTTATTNLLTVIG